MDTKFKSEIFDIIYDAPNLRHIVMIKIPDMLKDKFQSEEFTEAFFNEIKYQINKTSTPKQ